MDVTLKQLAAVLGLTDRQVRRLRDEQGILQPVQGTGGSTRAKKYRLETCVPEYIAFKVQGAENDGGTVIREKEQAEHERIKKKISELKLRKLRSELHEARNVEEFLTDMLVRFRARLITIPQKVAPLVIAEEDVNRVRSIIEGEVFQAIDELSEYDPARIDSADTSGISGSDDDDEEEEDDD